ncbi:hypothetical protein H8356DRAFT_1330043 [Neocallimastix lanati (nom. inval.)]|nr:hypothetical protein H8356DRAFT_1330043 [Neocallimastix sp. JGI-2020a]
MQLSETTLSEVSRNPNHYSLKTFFLCTTSIEPVQKLKNFDVMYTMCSNMITIELLTIGSVLGTQDYTNPLPYRYDIGTLGNKSVFVKLLENKIFHKPHNKLNSRTPGNFLGVVYLNVSVPQYRIITHLKLKFHQEKTYKYTWCESRLSSSINDESRESFVDTTLSILKMLLPGFTIFLFVRKGKFQHITTC